MIDVSYPWDSMPRHWRDRAIAWGARNIARPSLARPATWAAHRRGFRTVGAIRALARPRATRHRKIALGPLGALEITPPNPERRLIWVHGGGFILGAPETHLAMMSHLALAANALVIAPRYR
ncbi:MAG: alpha/beta hydrolase fold domain-containing protein, partial [Pseudomonadota bacterium]